MDKNSITGVILIVAIVFGYNYLYPPVIETPKSDVEKTIVVEEEINTPFQEIETTTVNLEEYSSNQYSDVYGSFASSATGSNTPIIIENEKMELTISPKGGRIISAILKEYVTSKGDSLNLISADSSKFNLSFFSENRIINTEDLFFSAFDQTDNSVRMRLLAENGGYLEYVYSLRPNDYMVDFEVNNANLQNLIPANQNIMELDWSVNLPHTEKSLENERLYSTTYFKYLNDEVDYLSV